MGDIQRYKRKVLANFFKRGDSSLFLQSIRGVAVFIFIAGLVSIVNAEELSNLVSLNESAQEEIVVDKDAQKLNLASAHPFLSARLINSTDASVPKKENENAVGGAFDSAFATAQGSSFLTTKFPTVPDAPIQERDEIIEYIVKPGDTASSIARSFGLKLETLLWSNRFRNSNYIKPGDVLSILPLDGVLYEIKTGDVLSVVAKKHKAEVEKILITNGIEDESHIFAGQIIIIPEGIKPPVPRRASSTPAPRYASSLQDLGGYFIRPIAGGRITQWLHPNNAVDIADSCWTPVYATASGTVGISIGNGRWNGGYGSYITINHYNGTMTLYAHLIKTAVASGQGVVQGQVIGYVGSTGRSTGCHVHWEVRGARNPLAY